MNISLTVHGTTYTVQKVTPRMVRRVNELLEESMKAKTTAETNQNLDDIVSFIASDVFREQFTVDDFMDGFESEQVIVDILLILTKINGALLGALNPEAKEETEKKRLEEPQKAKKPNQMQDTFSLVSDWVDSLYIRLLKEGWRFNDIDEMDIIYWLHLNNFQQETKPIVAVAPTTTVENIRW